MIRLKDSLPASMLAWNSCVFLGGMGVLMKDTSCFSRGVKLPGSTCLQLMEKHFPENINLIFISGITFKLISKIPCDAPKNDGLEDVFRVIEMEVFPHKTLVAAFLLKKGFTALPFWSVQQHLFPMSV